MLLIMSSSPQKKISGQQFKRTSLTPHGIGECLRSFPQFVMPLTLTFASPIGIFPASPSGCSGTHWARTPLTSTFARRACRSADSSAPAAPRRRSARQPVCPGTVFVACASSGNENDDDAIDGDSLFLRGPVPGDRIVRTMSANGEVSVRVMACTGLVSGATRLHRTSPVATAAFGRTLACSLLLAAGKKDGETLQIEFRGDGPIRGITAIANGEGCVRGYLGDPRIALPPNAAGKLDVAKAVGKGILAVVRNSKYAQQPYTGLVPITTGEIAEDVAVYLADSEQTPSALGVGVYVSETGSVTGAGGFLVQLLPGASEETISTVEKNVAALAPVCIDRHEAPYSLIGISPTDLVRQGKSVDEICQLIMAGLEPLQVQSSAPRYHCQCTVERVKRTVALIPEIEVYDLLAKEGQIEATCEFCGRVWHLDRADVEKLFSTGE